MHTDEPSNQSSPGRAGAAAQLDSERALRICLLRRPEGRLFHSRRFVFYGRGIFYRGGDGAIPVPTRVSLSYGRLGAAAFLGRMFPTRRIGAPTLFNFSSIFS